MGICIKNIRYNILNTRTRMPFRFGIVTMTASPHLFVTAEIEADGKTGRGIAAEGLLPKWFTKNPESTYREEIDDMLLVIKSACDIGMELGECSSVFRLWQDIYREQKKRCQAKGIPGLLWGFGVSMIERAVIDAYCRIKKVTFREALEKNLLGIELGEVHDELKGIKLHELLDLKGITPMYARHTVGLTDYLRKSEIKPEDAVNDGLPQALEDCIKVYGLNRLKIKLSGDIKRDISRLIDISGILHENNIPDCAFTLDGNENFDNAGDFVAFWEDLNSRNEIKDFLGRLIFVEQPIKRTTALSDGTKNIFNSWRNKPPMIIDESDSEIESLITALDCGYEGTSHKNCKRGYKRHCKCVSAQIQGTKGLG